MIRILIVDGCDEKLFHDAQEAIEYLKDVTRKELDMTESEEIKKLQSELAMSQYNEGVTRKYAEKLERMVIKKHNKIMKLKKGDQND